MCLPSVPAQLEVINTGNPIQRQETPLPPTEFKLNALLFFLAKSRFTWLEPAEPDVDLAAQFSRVTHRQADRPSKFQSHCCLRFITGPFIRHYSKSLSYSIFLLDRQDLNILEYLWKVYFIFFFSFFFFIAPLVQIGPHRLESLPLQ